jgi:hypothetical protein
MSVFGQIFGTTSPKVSLPERKTVSFDKGIQYAYFDITLDLNDQTVVSYHKILRVMIPTLDVELLKNFKSVTSNLLTLVLPYQVF